VTTDFVLGETLTILKKRNARISAIQDVTRDLLSSPLLKLVYVDEPLFRQALLNFRKYEELSFTDAVSLTVMGRYKIREIYSHDRDFDLKGITRKERPRMSAN
jgi:predicted nucleic acid-binding protein